MAAFDLGVRVLGLEVAVEGGDEGAVDVVGLEADEGAGVGLCYGWEEGLLGGLFRDAE